MTLRNDEYAKKVLEYLRVDFTERNGAEALAEIARYTGWDVIRDYAASQREAEQAAQPTYYAPRQPSPYSDGE